MIDLWNWVQWHKINYETDSQIFPFVWLVTQWDVSLKKKNLTSNRSTQPIMINLLDFLSDIDECAQNTHNCNMTGGVCKNKPGSFRCSCKPGFTVDGHNCEGLTRSLGITQLKINAYDECIVCNLHKRQLSENVSQFSFQMRSEICNCSQNTRKRQGIYRFLLWSQM